MKKPIGFSLCILLSALSCRINAEGNRYQIELLVFEQGVQSTAVSRQTDSLIHWSTALTELSGIQQTDSKMLQDGASKLLQRPSYRLIMHNTWMQSVGPGGVILPMHIKSEDGRLDGFIQLRHNQPFELIVDFEEQSLQTDSMGKRFLYRINEKRSFNLNEIQYFDHPKIGAIVQVSQL